MNAHDVIFCTAPIVAKNSTEQSTATGFFVKNQNEYYIVTNKHVIEERDCIEVICKCQDAENLIYDKQLNFNYIQSFTKYHPEYDLCIINIHNIINHIRQNQMDIINYFIDLDSQTDILYNDIESVITCGYPCGFQDKFNHLPLVNNGITSTSLNYNYNGKQIFLTNTHIYNGSSGSPVFVKRENNYSFVGINYAIQPLPYADDKLELIDERYKQLFKYMSSSVFSENIKKNVLNELVNN